MDTGSRIFDGWQEMAIKTNPGMKDEMMAKSDLVRSETDDGDGKNEKRKSFDFGGGQKTRLCLACATRVGCWLVDGRRRKSKVGESSGNGWTKKESMRVRVKVSG